MKCSIGPLNHFESNWVKGNMCSVFINLAHYKMKLVLASTSPFRRQLLDKLKLIYETDSPDIDESPLSNESIEDMVVRLAEGKARAVAHRHPDSLIIGSDQSAVLNGEPLTKPGGYDKAFAQLKAASGQRIVFYTSLCLLNTQTSTIQSACVPYTVVFKELTDAVIQHYLQLEQPYNCAGSFKSEGLGIALFKRFEGEDPNALIGLPLISLVNMLNKENMPPI